MATHTITVYPSKCAIISSSTPNAVIPVTANVTLGPNNENALIVQFDVKSALNGKIPKKYVPCVRLTGLDGTIGAADVSYQYPAGRYNLSGEFDLTDDATWNNVPWPLRPIGYDSWKGMSVDASKINTNIELSEFSPAPASGTFIFWNDEYLIDKDKPIITTGAAVNKPYLVITADDSVPAATELTPTNIYFEGNRTQRLAWKYANDTGGNQKAFAIQKSTDGTTWIDVASMQSPNQYYDAPAGTFAAGTAYWRVKVTSQWDIQSEWSEAALVMVISAPATPAITAVDATPRPTVSWQSTGQQAYQVRIGSHDSGIVYGTDKSYKSPVYLPDGETPVMVRIMNQYRMWSGWAEMIATIAHAGVAAIDLRATHDSSEVYLDWTGAHDIYYVYRDGELIARTKDKAYVDHMAIGAHDYGVRGATGDAYDLSRDVAVTACCKTAMIAEVGVYDWIHLKCKRQGKPSTSASITQQVTYQHYAGRELPVADITEYSDEAYTFAYSVLHDTGALRALLGKTVVIKTPRGECVIGVLESMPYERDRWSTDYTLTIRAVDYKPGVTYDV